MKPNESSVWSPFRGKSRIFIRLLCLWTVLCACLSLVFACQPRPPAPSERSAATGEYIVHEIQSGETLSEIAVRYYGTYQKYPTVEAIMDFNQISDARVLKSGERIRIPILVIDGVKIPSAASRSAPPPAPEASESDFQAGVRQLNAGNPAEAVPLLEKAFKGNPEDGEHRRYLGMALFQKAIQDYENGRLKTAQSGFMQVLRMKGDCIECTAYLKKIEQSAETRFDQGVKWFQKLKFDAAADAFELVWEILPEHPELNAYLFKTYFEISVDRFKSYQLTGEPTHLRNARESIKKARRFGKSCGGCADYEEAHKKNLYNQGIKHFTEKDGKGLAEAIRLWEQVQFIDPDYKEVRRNLNEAHNLLQKLKELG